MRRPSCTDSGFSLYHPVSTHWSAYFHHYSCSIYFHPRSASPLQFFRLLPDTIFHLLQPTGNPVPYCLHRMYNFCRWFLPCSSGKLHPSCGSSKPIHPYQSSTHLLSWFRLHSDNIFFRPRSASRSVLHRLCKNTRFRTPVSIRFFQLPVLSGQKLLGTYLLRPVCLLLGSGQEVPLRFFFSYFFPPSVSNIDTDFSVWIPCQCLTRDSLFYYFTFYSGISSKSSPV